MMRCLSILTLSLLMGGCVTLPSREALCAATESARKAHASALLHDGGPRSKESGVRLLSGLKAGCEE
jgi:hypothetical protein